MGSVHDFITRPAGFIRRIHPSARRRLRAIDAEPRILGYSLVVVAVVVEFIHAGGDRVSASQLLTVVGVRLLKHVASEFNVSINGDA